MSEAEVEAELKEKYADVLATKNKGQIMKNCYACILKDVQMERLLIS